MTAGWPGVVGLAHVCGLHVPVLASKEGMGVIPSTSVVMNVTIVPMHNKTGPTFGYIILGQEDADVCFI